MNASKLLVLGAVICFTLAAMLVAAPIQGSGSTLRAPAACAPRKQTQPSSAAIPASRSASAST